MSAIEFSRWNFERAAQLAKEQLELANQLHALDQSAGRSYGMSSALSRMSAVSVESGQIQAALGFSRQAAEYTLEAYDRAPDKVFFLNCAASRFRNAGKLARRVGQFRVATDLTGQAVHRAEQAVAADPSVSSYQANLVRAHADIASAAMKQKQFELAESSSRSWLREAAKLYEVAPDKHKSCSNLLNAYRTLAIALYYTERTDEGRAFATRGIAFAEEILRNPEQDADFLIEFSKYVRYVKPSDLRNPGRAMQLAKRAVDLTRGEDPNMLIVLASTYKYLGDVELGIATLRQAIELLSPRNHALRPKIEELLIKWQDSSTSGDPR